MPGNSDTIDIEQLLKQLLPVDTVVEKTGQPTPESQEVDAERRETSPDPGRGVSHPDQ